MTEHASITRSLLGVVVQQWQEGRRGAQTGLESGFTVRVTFLLTGDRTPGKLVLDPCFGPAEDFRESVDPACRFVEAWWPDGFGVIRVRVVSEPLGSELPLIGGSSMGLTLALGAAGAAAEVSPLAHLPIDGCDLTRVAASGTLSPDAAGGYRVPAIEPVGGIKPKLEQLRKDIDLFDALILSEDQRGIAPHFPRNRAAPGLRPTGDSDSYYSMVDGRERLVIRAATVPDAIAQLERAQTAALLVL